jgi:hypothetical protein
MPFYCNTAHKLKGTGIKTKRILIDYMIKFIIRATRVSKSFHRSATLTVVKMACQVGEAECML